LKKTLLILVFCLLLTISCQSTGSLFPSNSGGAEKPPAKLDTATQISFFTPTSANTLTPDPTPPIINTPTIEAINCDLSSVIKKVKKAIPYQEFSVEPNTFQGERLLSIWYVDESIDTSSAPNIEKESIKALENGVILSFDIANSDPCIFQLFTQINPIVVDKNHNGWFSGNIPVDSIPLDNTINQAHFDEIMENIAILYLKNQSPLPQEQPPEDSCSFKTAQENILYHFNEERVYPGVTYTIDESFYHVDVQWESAFDPDEVKMWWALQFASILNVIVELPCLYPPPNMLNITILDYDGKIILIAYLPNPVRPIDQIDFNNELIILYQDSEQKLDSNST